MLPLVGVRVLAVEQYGAGPFGTMFLADQGAEVIKIENPNDGGDMGRTVGPYFIGDGKSSSASLFYQSINRNKRSLTLDLSKPEGQELVHALVRTKLPGLLLDSKVKEHIAAQRDLPVGVDQRSPARHPARPP